MTDFILLDRQFSPLPKRNAADDDDEQYAWWKHNNSQGWNDLVSEFRCVILAEAGAGKTEEFKQQAAALAKEDKTAFFIRIEDIDSNFANAFEIGEAEQFNDWLTSSDEAWFFLDSVDEARLDNPRTFEKALRFFANKIKNSAHRAHIYLSSRPYAWRPVEDRRLMDEILFFAAPSDDKQSGQKSALTVYLMNPLDKKRIRLFCEQRNTQEIDALLAEIERTNLWSLAERPFDLASMLAKWRDDRALGSRLALLRHNIERQLQDGHNTNRERRQSLNLEQAKQGARRLAAAVVLTGQAGMNVPDSIANKPAIDAVKVLSDWEPANVHVLLEHGLFNDVIYGAVRFRHREVRELLAAEWFDDLLKTGHSRRRIEALFFREQYGEQIVCPRLGPILPWLMLLDSTIRQKTLSLRPEIALEGGDASCLPLADRQKILSDVVKTIVDSGGTHDGHNNDAIARIASTELAADTLRWINQYGSNDDVIFFLGRMVWQGKMSNCLPPLMAIALDQHRGIYARMVSIRAIMSCGTTEQQQDLWLKLNQTPSLIPRKLLTELISGTEANQFIITQLLVSVSKLTAYEPYQHTGLTHSLHDFIRRLPGNDESLCKQFIEGLYDKLTQAPHLEHCGVSQEYSWLIQPAEHVVERLVEARSPVALSKAALLIMLMAPELSLWYPDSFSHASDYKSQLVTLVPQWAELNDALYWASIEQARHKDPATAVTDDYAVARIGHYWRFGLADWPRLIEFIRSRSLLDDQRVALSTAFRVYYQFAQSVSIRKESTETGFIKAFLTSCFLQLSGAISRLRYLFTGNIGCHPKNFLAQLHATVSHELILQQQLTALLNPPNNDEWLQKQAKRKEEQQQRVAHNKQQRDVWIAQLQTNPERVRHPENRLPGKMTNEQHWLLQDICFHDSNSHSGRHGGENWQLLIPDFGEAVALAYRDAAIQFWRQYQPVLQSEGDILNKSTPYALIFAMSGLEIEAKETDSFPQNLTESEVHLALRYLTWELSGFPRWFETMYRAYPTWTLDAVMQELIWELEHTDTEKPMHYILNRLVYAAPWLHPAIAPKLFDWMMTNLSQATVCRYYCRWILVSGGIEPEKLAELAQQQLRQMVDADIKAWWYAVWVDCAPAVAIVDLEQWVSSLSREQATNAAQIFAATLVGSYRNNDGPRVGAYRTASHLKALYTLLHQYVRIEDDIERANGGAYTPELRDDAQNARESLFNLLKAIPNIEGYTALKQLINEHPVARFRPWMQKQAYQRAEQDGDLESWSAQQVAEFHQSQTATPQTHRQLFDLAVERLLDLKDVLERGNDSLWQTWQRAEQETEMRNLIANWLNRNCRDQYVTAQEPELANSQRMDIILHNTAVQSPVPIELKLLDQNWSGPALCERLRNQLVGDYLREQGASCGVMLLVAKNTGSKQWEINQQRVELGRLNEALEVYWQSIAHQYPTVANIKVVVIDLAKRSKVSKT